jgi:hypothetical protein
MRCVRLDRREGDQVQVDLPELRDDSEELRGSAAFVIKNQLQLNTTGRGLSAGRLRAAGGFFTRLFREEHHHGS